MNKKLPPFSHKHKKFDWAKAINEARRIVMEIQQDKYREGLKHCRCCPAHPEYNEMYHEAYE